VTLGEPVVVSLTNGTSLDGTASAVTNTGALVVDGVEVAAGDVQHVRSI
jgi:biotin-(acetyl-CoA carboxylase) ligase